MQTEIRLDIALGFLVDFEEVDGFLSQLRAGLGENSELFEVVAGKLHIAPLFALVETLRENVPGIPLNEVVELDGSEVVPYEEGADAGNLYAAGSGLNKICSYIMCFLAEVLQHAVQSQFDAVLGHVGVGGHLRQVDLGHWHFTIRAVNGVWAHT